MSDFVDACVLTAKLKDVMSLIQTNSVISSSPLYGVLHSHINNAQNTLRLIYQLDDIVAPLDSKGNWSSLLRRLENYKALKEENKVLRDKLDSIKAAINDNPS